MTNAPTSASSSSSSSSGKGKSNKPAKDSTDKSNSGVVQQLPLRFACFSNPEDAGGDSPSYLAVGGDDKIIRLYDTSEWPWKLVSFR